MSGHRAAVDDPSDPPGAATGIHRHEHRHAGETHRHPHHHATARGPAHEHRHVTGFERLTLLVSPMHDLDPRAKIAAALVLVLAIALSPPMRLAEFVSLVALLIAASLIARLPVSAVLARASLVLPFAAGIALFAPLAARGGSISLGAFEGSYASGGWIAAWSVLSRAWLSAFVMVVLAATTPIPRLLKGLAALRLPSVFVTLLSFISRYVGVLGDQLRSVRRALDSRAPVMRRLRRWRVYGGVAGNLVVRAYDRGERIHAAMLSRGFDGTLPVAEPLALAPADAVVVIVSALAAGAIVLY